MTENEIHQHYKDTFVPEVRNNLCTGVVSLLYPEAGQIVKDKINFEFKITNHGACTDPDFLAGFFTGDSLEVQLSTDPSFSNIALDVVAQTTLVNLEGLDLAKFSNFQGQIYWRARLKSNGQRALKKTVAMTPMLPGDWSLSRPMILDLSQSTGIGRSEKKIKSATSKKKHGLFRKGRGGSSSSMLVDLSGKKHSNSKTKVPKP